MQETEEAAGGTERRRLRFDLRRAARTIPRRARRHRAAIASISSGRCSTSRVSLRSASLPRRSASSPSCAASLPAVRARPRKRSADIAERSRDRLADAIERSRRLARVRVAVRLSRASRCSRSCNSRSRSAARSIGDDDHAIQAVLLKSAFPARNGRPRGAGRPNASRQLMFFSQLSMFFSASSFA